MCSNIFLSESPIPVQAATERKAISAMSSAYSVDVAPDRSWQSLFKMSEKRMAKRYSPEFSAISRGKVNRRLRCGPPLPLACAAAARRAGKQA